jgi:hypothetical protein
LRNRTIARDPGYVARTRPRAVRSALRARRRNGNVFRNFLSIAGLLPTVQSAAYSPARATISV